MKKTKNFIYSQIHGWALWETIWFFGTCAAVVVLSIILKDSLMGIISAVSGIAYVVLNGKGKLSAYFFGLINSVLYAIISYKATLYGETMLNAFYYVPMQFIGFFVWSRNMNKSTDEVIKRRMNTKKRLYTAATICVGTVIYGLALRSLHDAMPFIDAFTTVASVIALAVSVKMYSEQWHIWICIDAVTVFMWFKSTLENGNNAATLIMWIIYTVTGVLMLIKWEKEVKRNGDITDEKK